MSYRLWERIYLHRHKVMRCQWYLALALGYHSHYPVVVNLRHHNPDWPTAPVRTPGDDLPAPEPLIHLPSMKAILDDGQLHLLDQLIRLDADQLRSEQKARLSSLLRAATSKAPGGSGAVVKKLLEYLLVSNVLVNREHQPEHPIAPLNRRLYGCPAAASDCQTYMASLHDRLGLEDSMMARPFYDALQHAWPGQPDRPCSPNPHFQADFLRGSNNPVGSDLASKESVLSAILSSTGINSGWLKMMRPHVAQPVGKQPHDWQYDAACAPHAPILPAIALQISARQLLADMFIVRSSLTRPGGAYSGQHLVQRMQLGELCYNLPSRCVEVHPAFSFERDGLVGVNCSPYTWMAWDDYQVLMENEPSSRDTASSGGCTHDGLPDDYRRRRSPAEAAAAGSVSC